MPKSVGTANLVARAGEASAEFKVDVVRKVVVEALPIEQNKKLYFSLEPGKYELKIKLPEPAPGERGMARRAVLQCHIGGRRAHFGMRAPCKGGRCGLRQSGILEGWLQDALGRGRRAVRGSVNDARQPWLNP